MQTGPTLLRSRQAFYNLCHLINYIHARDGLISVIGPINEKFIGSYDCYDLLEERLSTDVYSCSFPVLDINVLLQLK